MTAKWQGHIHSHHETLAGALIVALRPDGCELAGFGSAGGFRGGLRSRRSRSFVGSGAVLVQLVGGFNPQLLRANSISNRTLRVGSRDGVEFLNGGAGLKGMYQCDSTAKPRSPADSDVGQTLGGSA